MKKTKLALIILLTFYFMNLSYAQDWANLNRYKKENNALQTLELGKHRTVFMGNSITESWITFRPSFFANKAYVNRGISGQTTPQMLIRFRQDAINIAPSVIIILAGINDIAENTGPIAIEMIADNIFSMAELAKANHINVILCSVLPAIDFPWIKGMEPADKIIKLNSILKSYANKHNILYVDYYAVMVNDSKGLKKELSSDGVHPNEAGYLLMEPLIEAAISKTLAKRKFN